MNDYEYQFKFIMIGDSSTLSAIQVWERVALC